MIEVFCISSIHSSIHSSRIIAVALVTLIAAAVALRSSSNTHSSSSGNIKLAVVQY